MAKGEANMRDVRQEAFKPTATNLCAGKKEEKLPQKMKFQNGIRTYMRREKES
jgi:hypothetical protein